MTKYDDDLETELKDLLKKSSERIAILDRIRLRDDKLATPDEASVLKMPVTSLPDDVICLMLETKSHKRKIKESNYQPFLIRANDSVCFALFVEDKDKYPLADDSSAKELNNKIVEHVGKKDPFHYDFIIRTGNHCSPMQVDSDGEKVRMFYLDAGLNRRNDEYALSLINSYRLALMSSLEDRAHPSFGKIYVDENGQYILRAQNGELIHGELEGIELSDLSSKIDAPKFKQEILTFTSSKGHTPLIDHQDVELKDLQDAEIYGYIDAGIQNTKVGCSIFSMQHLNNLSNRSLSDKQAIDVDNVLKLPAVFLKNIQSTSTLTEYNKSQSVNKQGTITLEQHIAQYSITVEVVNASGETKIITPNYARDYKEHKYLQAALDKLTELKADPDANISQVINARKNCNGKNTSSVTADLGSSKTSTSTIPSDKTTCVSHFKDCKKKLNDMLDHESAHTHMESNSSSTPNPSDESKPSTPSPFSTNGPQMTPK